MHRVFVCAVSLFLASCQAQTSANTPYGSVTVVAPPSTLADAFTVTRASKVPFALPTRQTCFRLLMLTSPRAVRGPVFKLTLYKSLQGEVTIAYDFKTAPQGKDRYTEVFLFDGQAFDLLGRQAGSAVSHAPLDPRPLVTKSRREIYIFGMSFTRAQYREACAPIGRFNGSYCGPK